MSDEEEDSLHYHHNNRIKAGEISKDDFVYFTQSQSEKDSSSELGWQSQADSSRGGDCSDKDWVPQTSAHHIAMMASKRGHVKDTGHDSDGEDSTLSDVKSDDEISPRDERARRRARDPPSAELTTENLEVRVKGQDGVNEVVDDNSGHTKSSPRFYIGSTGALPGRGIGDERFLGGRTRRPNNNRTSLRSALTGRFISPRLLTQHSPNTALRVIATAPFIHGGSANDRESSAIDRVV